MRADAYPHPERYRPTFISMAFPGLPTAGAATAEAQAHAVAIPERRENRR